VDSQTTLAQAPARVSPVRQPTPHSVCQPVRKSVTLVDDEPYALDILVRAARSWEFDCQGAASAEEAIRLLEVNPTPIVVTDLRMPGMGGVWLVQEVQRRWPGTSIIVVTAGQDEDGLAKCLYAGAHHYFLKPINFDEFRHALDSTLRAYTLRRDEDRYRRRLEHALQRQRRQLKTTFFSAIDSLVRTIEARDPYTSGHSRRVCRYAVGLGRRLNLDERRIKRLALAAKLHDIGKIGLPEGILNKPGTLSPAEIGEVRDHPVVGERILAPIIRNREVLAAIRHHHERLDGDGYPDGLRGDAIPLLARIITVADCFDALTTSRAYRAALTPAAALDILRTDAGRQFDPELVPAFTRMVQCG
jgi:putative two-component system response regulator